MQSAFLTIIVVAFIKGANGDVPSGAREQTAQYLQFRFRNGEVQPEWIRALNSQVKKLNPVDGKDSGPPLLVRRAKSWGAGSVEGLRAWVSENNGLVEALIELPRPSGPLPVEADYSILKYSVIGSPGPAAIREKARLLFAAAISAESNAARASCISGVLNLVDLSLKGYESIELSTACFVEMQLWELLLNGLYDDPESYRQIILSTPGVVNQNDLAISVRECHRRFILTVASDPVDGGLVTDSLSDSQLRDLDALYVRLANKISTMKSGKELNAFQQMPRDPILRQIIGEEFKAVGLIGLAEQVMYLSDLRSITRALAKSGVDAAARVSTTMISLHLEGGELRASFNKNEIQLWPLHNGVSGGFAKLTRSRVSE